MSYCWVIRLMYRIKIISNHQVRVLNYVENLPHRQCTLEIGWLFKRSYWSLNETNITRYGKW